MMRKRMMILKSFSSDSNLTDEIFKIIDYITLQVKKKRLIVRRRVAQSFKAT